MQIRCPRCEYSKELDDAAIPAEMVYATCPECGERFRFRQPEQAGVPADPALSGGAVREFFLDAEAGQQAAPEKPYEIPGVQAGREEQGGRAYGNAPAGHGNYGAESGGNPGTAQPELPRIPWAWRSQIGWASAFVHTVREVLSAPPVFFSRSGNDWKRAGAMTFYVISSALGVLFAQMWAWAMDTFLGDVLSEGALAAAGGGFPGWSAALGVTAVVLVLGPLFFFVSAGILHAGLSVVKGAPRGFGATANVVAFSLSANMFYLVPFIGQYLAVIFGIYALVVGMKYAHGVNVWRVAAGLLMPFLFIMAFYVVALVVVYSRGA
ncbi:hypothetical protein DSM19430T_18500 [Desulfovibrio psychrotolerans]|uniref:Yip1 domain-containing protein n=1 Tax=Desulfovibrio psychrotolerans TaxID=415242 RepID=A0A7J0BTW9_9BACT|nr:hypothetical protein DSM19430T_18500 [Desulfovibrio psychrotolerans]